MSLIEEFGGRAEAQDASDAALLTEKHWFSWLVYAVRRPCAWSLVSVHPRVEDATGRDPDQIQNRIAPDADALPMGQRECSLVSGQGSVLALRGWAPRDSEIRTR